MLEAVSFLFQAVTPYFALLGCDQSLKGPAQIYGTPLGYKRVCWCAVALSRILAPYSFVLFFCHASYRYTEQKQGRVYSLLLLTSQWPRAKGMFGDMMPRWCAIACCSTCTMLRKQNSSAAWEPISFAFLMAIQIAPLLLLLCWGDHLQIPFIWTLGHIMMNLRWYY